MWPPLTPCALQPPPQVIPYFHIQVDVAATHTLCFTTSPTGDPIPSHPVDAATTPTLHSLKPYPQVTPYLHIQADVTVTPTLHFTISPTGDPLPSHPGRCGCHSHLCSLQHHPQVTLTFTSRQMWPSLPPCTLLSHQQVSPYLHIQANVATTHTLRFTISPTGDPIPSHPGKCGCYSHLALRTSSPTDSPIPSHPGRCDMTQQNMTGP